MVTVAPSQSEKELRNTPKIHHEIEKRLEANAAGAQIRPYSHQKQVETKDYVPVAKTDDIKNMLEVLKFQQCVISQSPKSLNSPVAPELKSSVSNIQAKLMSFNIIEPERLSNDNIQQTEVRRYL